MDYIYKPFALKPENLKTAVDAVRALGIRGCGVSMPHKTVIHEHLDSIDPIAKKIGAINTVVNTGGILTGYNTDYIGAEKVLKENFDMKGKTAHIIGAGGAARAIMVALLEIGAAKVIVSNRDDQKSKEIVSEFNIEFCSKENQGTVKADLLVNATPVGMAPGVDEMIVEEASLLHYEAVLDVVVFPFTTKLIQTAKSMNKIVMPGYKMALYQAAGQFTLYTGLEAPLDFMLEEMKKVAV